MNSTATIEENHLSKQRNSQKKKHLSEYWNWKANKLNQNWNKIENQINCIEI